jgi:aspartate/glutamate racemase
MTTTTPFPSGVHRAVPGVAAGYPIGMLCLQWNIPFVPGDLNNARTFDFPVRYLEVDVPGAEVLRGRARNFAEVLIRGARQLQAEGVEAITGNCGFMITCQDEVAAAVDVPVFLSSLVQAPLVSRLVGPARKIGILTANAAALTPDFLRAGGVEDPRSVAVQGLEQFEHFREVILDEIGVLDIDRLTSEVVEGARKLADHNPGLGAILLECSDLPVYSRAIREVTGLPVFDWVSFIDYVHRAVAPRRYP